MVSIVISIEGKRYALQILSKKLPKLCVANVDEFLFTYMDCNMLHEHTKVWFNDRVGPIAFQRIDEFMDGWFHIQCLDLLEDDFPEHDDLVFY